MTDKVTKDDVYRVINDGVWYYNKLGKVGCLPSPTVDSQYIKGKLFGYSCCFDWVDINKSFFLSEQQAQKEAQKYLDEVLKYINITTLTKIVKLTKNDILHLYHKDNDYIEDRTLEAYSHWDKYNRAFIVVTEYDDDWGGGCYEEEYPISEYGKTWALTEEELKHNETI